MISSGYKLTYRVGLAALVLLLAGGVVWGDGPEIASPEETAPRVDLSGQEEGVLQEQPEPMALKEESHTLINAYSGYRFFAGNDFGGRAAEYEYLHSNPVFYGLADYLSKDTRVFLEGGYLNEKDYHGDLAYDYRGIYRLKLWTESLWHNLDHDPLFSPPFTLSSGSTTAPVDLDPATVYGVRVEQDLAQFRYKPERFPLHLNLGYWRMLREGTGQLRFADHAFEGTPNTIYSRGRLIDAQTHEGQFGADAHMGYFDLTYTFLIREFSNHAPIPQDVTFIARPAPIARPSGIYQHNEDPDSRFYSHKIGVHTSMSGGLVGAVTYAYGKRENRSSLTDITGASQTSDTTHNVAGDLNYTPCGYFTLALKYRHFQIDRDPPASVGSDFAASPFLVRPGITTEKDTVIASLIYRPIKLLTIKGEYKGEFVSRGNLDQWFDPGRIASLTYPSNSTTNTGSLTVISRPRKGVRVQAQYLYSTTDNPAYASNSEEKHQGSLQAAYTAANSWGITASTRISRETNNQATVTTIVPDPSVPVTLANTTTFHMPKDRTISNATMSVWLVPLNRLTLAASYGLLRTSSDQAVLFSGPVAGSNASTNYTQQSQIYSVNGTYHYNEKVDLSLMLQQVRSYAQFDPQFISVPAVGDTGGIQQISQLKTVESSLAARADYRFTNNVSFTTEYTFRDYADKVASLFNGSVNTVMVYLAAKW